MQYNSLLEKLDEFTRKYYKNQLIRGILYTLTGLLSYFLIASTLEYFGRFGNLMRGILFYGFALFSLFVLYRWIIIPLMKLYKMGKIISYEEAANIIGKHFSNVQDKLLNVLQLRQQAVNTPNNILLEAGIDQKINQLKPVPFVDAVDLSENKRQLKYLFPVLLVALLLLIFIPGVFTEAPVRIIEHDSRFEPAAPFQFHVGNKALSALKNEDFDLEVNLSGEQIPEKLYIEYNGNHFILDKKDKLSFSYTFKNVQKDIPFHLSADGFSSHDYTLKVLPKPLLLNFGIKLDYPSYTGKQDETIDNNGDLIVPQGTKISWEFNTRDADKLDFILADSSFTLDPSGKDRYSFKIRAMHSFPYGLKPENKVVAKSDTIDYQLTVIPDLYPSIDLQSRADSITNKLIYFKGFIKDDYGLSRLTFNYKELNDSTGNKGGKWKSEEIPISSDVLQQQYFYTWNLEPFGLKPGQKMIYYFEVWDNDGVNGHKSTKTATSEFGIPEYKELAEKSDQQGKSLEKDIQNSITKAMELKSGLDQLNQSMFDKKNMGWEEKQKIEDLIKLHDDLKKNVDRIQQNNEKKNSLDQEYMKLDPQLLEKQQQLQKLFKDLMTPEMKKMFEQLQEMMKQMNKNQLQQQLDKIKLSNKDIEKELIVP